MAVSMNPWQVQLDSAQSKVIDHEKLRQSYGLYFMYIGLAGVMVKATTAVP